MKLLQPGKPAIAIWLGRHPSARRRPRISMLTKPTDRDSSATLRSGARTPPTVIAAPFDHRSALAGRVPRQRRVQNMPQFQPAFSCKSGPAMVAPKACRVW